MRNLIPFSVNQDQTHINNQISVKGRRKTESLTSPEWREHDENLDEVIRLSKEDLKNLNSGKKSEEMNWIKERLKERNIEGYFDESDFVEEPKLRRRKSKLERQNRCVSEESNKQCTKDTFTLADLQEEMKK